MPEIDRPEQPGTEDDDTVDYVPDPRDLSTLDVEPFHPGPDDYQPSDGDLAELAAFIHGQDGMAFPEKEYSLADRRRWQRQSNLSERSFYGG